MNAGRPTKLFHYNYNHNRFVTCRVAYLVSYHAAHKWKFVKDCIRTQVTRLARTVPKEAVNTFTEKVRVTNTNCDTLATDCVDDGVTWFRHTQICMMFIIRNFMMLFQSKGGYTRERHVSGLLSPTQSTQSFNRQPLVVSLTWTCKTPVVNPYTISRISYIVARLLTACICGQTFRPVCFK